MTEPTIIDTTAIDGDPIDPIAARLAPIRSALAANATADVRRAALDPLRALCAQIMASLDLGATPTVPTFAAPIFAAPTIAASASPLRGVTLDQVLDLVIVQLRAAVGDSADATGGPLAQLLGGAR